MLICDTFIKMGCNINIINFRMSRFNGVATKYLNNYLKWNKWINTFSTDKETVKTKNFIVHSNIPHSYTMVKDFKRIQPIFV